MQLLVQATYTGVRTQVATAYVNVTVTRNENTPQFSRGEYREDVLEYYPLGESILRITATDKDENVTKITKALNRVHLEAKTIIS